MQAATPLVQAFVMEALPPSLRARSTSLITLVWNCGWAVSATSSGILIQRLGYHVPFYLTATLYALAATIFYRAFRGVREGARPRPVPESVEGRPGEGPLAE
jgi:MFS family permease